MHRSSVIPTDHLRTYAWRWFYGGLLIVGVLIAMLNGLLWGNPMHQLKVGDVAPEFHAIAHDGQAISLAEYRGKSAVVLFFYPKDGTSVCTKEACAFRDSYEKFAEAGAVVIGVSSDSNESHRQFAKDHKLSFPLISDADGSLRKRFAVPSNLGFLPGRVTYVIDQQGIIRLIFNAAFASDGHVQQALQALATHSTGSASDAAP